MSRDIFMIYARARNGTIGKNGDLPWHIPADLKHFKALTIGKPMIMGRRTFESFGGPLPGRRHIVLTRDTAWRADGAEVAHSVDEALEMAGEGEIAIAGGAQIYDLFDDIATRAEITQIHADYDGDTKVPPLDEQWREVAREDHEAAGTRPAFSFVTYTRAL